MRTLKAASVALALLAAAGLVVGATGVSSVAADRGVNVSVVADERAYVALEACERPSDDAGGDGSTPVDVRVANQFAVTIDVTGVEDRTDRGGLPRGIDPGESETFGVVIDDSDPESVTVSVANPRGVVSATVTTDVHPADDCPIDRDSDGDDDASDGDGSDDGDDSDGEDGEDGGTDADSEDGDQDDADDDADDADGNGDDTTGDG